MQGNLSCNSSFAFTSTKNDKKLKQKQDEADTNPINNISEIKKKPNSNYQMKNEDFSQNMKFYSADNRNLSKPTYENGLSTIKKDNTIETQNENDFKNMLFYQQQQQPSKTLI